MIDSDKSARDYAEEQEMAPGLPSEFEHVIRAQIRNAFIAGSTCGLRIAGELVEKQTV